MNGPTIRRRRRPPNQWRGSTIAMGIAGSIITALAIAAFIIAIIALIRDAHHHDRTHNHIRSIGFSVFKNDTETIIDNTVTVIGGWASGGGAPAYDRTGGLLNTTAGTYAADKNAKYLAVGVLCFSASSTNGTIEARLATNGPNNANMITVNRAVGNTVLEGDQCLGVSQILDLPKGTMVWLEALAASDNSTSVTTGSRFSVERIATNK